MSKEAFWIKMFQCTNCGEVSSFPDEHCPFCHAGMVDVVDREYLKYRASEYEESEREPRDFEAF